MDHKFAVAPKKSLQDETWYDAVLESSLGNAVISADDVYKLGLGVVTRFYTTSAPQIRRVDVVQKEGAAFDSLIVQMSEDVDTGDIARGGLDVVTEGSSRVSCLVWNGYCLESTPDRPNMSAFEYRLTGKVPKSFRVILGLFVRGKDGKRVGNAAEVEHAIRGGASRTGNVLAYQFEDSIWRQRRNPHVMGWTNAEGAD